MRMNAAPRDPAGCREVEAEPATRPEMVASSRIGSVEPPPPVERRRRFNFERSDFQVLGVYLALALIWVILALKTPYFFTVPNIRNVLVQASTLSIIAAGLSIVLIAGEIDLAFATIQAFVGSIAAVLMVRADFPAAGDGPGHSPVRRRRDERRRGDRGATTDVHHHVRDARHHRRHRPVAGPTAAGPGFRRATRCSATAGSASIPVPVIIMATVYRPPTRRPRGREPG